MAPTGPATIGGTYQEVVTKDGIVYQATWNAIGGGDEGDEPYWPDEPDLEPIGTVDPDGVAQFGAGTNGVAIDLTLLNPDSRLVSVDNFVLAQVLGSIANKPPPDPLLSADSLVAQIARIIYRETSSLRPIEGQSTQADLQTAREMLAQIILNRMDTGNRRMAVGRGTASAAPITGSELTAIAVNRVPSAVAAWESSVAAAKKLLEAANLPPEERPARLTNDLYWNMRPGAAVNQSVNRGFGAAPDTWSPVFQSTSGTVRGPTRVYYYPGG